LWARDGLRLAGTYTRAVATSVSGSGRTFDVRFADSAQIGVTQLNTRRANGEAQTESADNNTSVYIGVPDQQEPAHYPAVSSRVGDIHCGGGKSGTASPTILLPGSGTRLDVFIAPAFIVPWVRFSEKDL
jgi:hypothetical protein